MFTNVRARLNPDILQRLKVYGLKVCVFVCNEIGRVQRVVIYDMLLSLLREMESFLLLRAISASLDLFR